MLLDRDYRNPFWHGFLHAVLVVIYLLFLSLIILNIEFMFQDQIGQVIRYTFNFFLIFLSVAVCGWLIFFEPLKKLLHHHFKAATVMMWSTIGWLFVFLILFILGLVLTLV